MSENFSSRTYNSKQSNKQLTEDMIMIIYILEREQYE